MKILRVGIFALVLCLVSACASFQQHKSTAELAVTYGTLKYIEKAGDADQQGMRAQKIAEVTLAVKQYVAGSEVTVDLLKGFIISKLPPEMGVADRVLIGALVDEVVAELQRRVGSSLIGPEQLLVVEEVADWVLSATKYAGV